MVNYKKMNFMLISNDINFVVLLRINKIIIIVVDVQIFCLIIIMHTF